MSKTLLVVILLTVLVLGGGIFFIKSNKNKVTKIDTPKKETILLYPEQGEVLYKTPSDQNFVKATTTPTEIPNLTVVHTGNGKATVLFSDNSNISLDKNTEITINVENGKFDIFQSIGTTYHRVEKLITGGSYEVKTPGTLAAVRGTKFAVTYDSNTKNTEVMVTEHQVEVMEAEENKDTQASSTQSQGKKERKSMIVKENQMLVVSEVKIASSSQTAETEKKMELKDLKKDLKMKKWVEENMNREESVNKVKLDVGDRKEEVREAVKDMIIKNVDVKVFKLIKEEVKKESEGSENKSGSNTEVKSDTSSELNKTNISNTNTTTNNTTNTTTVTTTVRTIATTTPKVVLSDEEFYTKFEDLFIKYFYVEDGDEICKLTITPEAKVLAVNKLASDNGKAFSKSTLLSFGEAIARYCASSTRDEKTRIDLQSRFDGEYPFR